LTVDNNAAPQTGPQSDDDGVPHSARAAEQQLSDCGGVGIVGNGNRQVVPQAEHLNQVYRLPPVQIGRVLNGPPMIVGIGSADTDSRNRGLRRKCRAQFQDGVIKTRNKDVCRLMSLRGQGCLTYQAAVTINQTEGRGRSADIYSDCTINRLHGCSSKKRCLMADEGRYG